MHISFSVASGVMLLEGIHSLWVSVDYYHYTSDVLFSCISQFLLVCLFLSVTFCAL